MVTARWVENACCISFPATRSSARNKLVWIAGERERESVFVARTEIVFFSVGINSLKIRNVNLDDDGIYQCQIGRTVEAREVLSNFANLTVLIPPDQISVTYVPPGIIISGKEFRISCEVVNTRPAPSFTWQTPPNTQIVNVSQETTPMTANSKLLKSVSTITLIADTNQHGQEVKCEATHVALNKSLASTTVIAVDCKCEDVAEAMEVFFCPCKINPW